MAEEIELLDDPIEEQSEDLPEDSFEQGEDSQDPNDWGPNGEKMPVEYQSIVCRWADECSEEDLFSRRIEVQEARRGRFFWRGLQNVNWNFTTESWEIIGPQGAGINTPERAAESSSLYVTNIYQGFGLGIQAVLSQNIPNVRWEPQDPEDAADMATAKAGNRYRKIIEHQNDAVKLMTELAYFAWTDGRIHAWTRSEKNTRTDAMQEKISMYGSLECKVPITAKNEDDFLYVQYSDEFNVPIIREEISKLGFEEGYEKKIKGGSSLEDQSTYERYARISVRQGISLVAQSGDTTNNLVTKQQTWIRPAKFQMLEDETQKQTFQKKFPKGIHIVRNSNLYCGAYNESIDDHWSVMHYMPGDGQFRNAGGTSLISVQERFNDIINIAQDTYEKTIPAGYTDDRLVDADSIERQVSQPGARYPVPQSELPPGEPLANHFYMEPPSSVSPDMLNYGNDLMGPVAQFLTGYFPALFGGSAEGAAGDTASGYAMQREQAMGRIGLPWNFIKRFWARIMGQVIRLSASTQKKDMQISIPDKNGDVEPTVVRLEELQGKVYAYPDVDEGIPDSYTAQRTIYMQLMAAADKNPALAAILAEPENMELGRQLIGLEDFVLPGADAERKQLAEIALMLKSVATPNPKFAQLTQQLAQMKAQAVSGQLLPDGAVEQLDMQLQKTPQMLPSIPIDPDLDDNANEFETGRRWASSEDGQKAKAENPEGYQNVRIHLLAHKAAIPPPPMPMPKGKAA